MAVGSEEKGGGTALTEGEDKGSGGARPEDSMGSEEPVRSDAAVAAAATLTNTKNFNPILLSL